jgi:NAD(P)-dependent dehydrogenase (short-subunit alcohol dehydrogenase family)
MTIPTPRDLLDFTDKVVLITGSSVGIGAGIALRFAQAGAQVVIHYHRHTAEAEQVAQAVTTQGGQAMTVQADVTQSAGVQQLFASALAHFGRVDVLVNNAGSYPVAPLLEMSETQWDETLAVNLKSCFLCTQAFARPLIQRSGEGSIVNIASIEAVNPAAGHAHYSAAKAGLVMFTKTAALELAQHQIRVNAVGPGLINAPALPTNWPDGLQRWLKRVPLGRLGEPADVADACLFLASPAARWITGVHLLVDGGILTTQIY